MKVPEHFFQDLPDEPAARRFADRLSESSPIEAGRLMKDEGLLSDALAIAAYSPLLAETLLQNTDYFSWLRRERNDLKVRDKDAFLESLARFSMTHSSVTPQVIFARFRRRELIRIFLADIRRLKTVAEITEELSNLADAILENALVLARQEMDNRFGPPLESDEQDRRRNSEACIVSLGKLGSRELNYSSDIDLMFIYSGEGETSGTGRRGKVSNREYFIKLVEHTTGLIGKQAGEGAAYRVDLRLRPYGRVGPLALSVADTIRYFRTEAAAWEKQVLIRSRSSAGESALFSEFIAKVTDMIYPTEISPSDALREVRLSKLKIDHNQAGTRGFDVKLGRGGIREIEFIAQAQQLAHGGGDRWIRAGHTLISLARIAEHGLISAKELVELSDAYEFLRRLEHILQMEHGLQTHLLPEESEKRQLVARRMGFVPEAFETELVRHADNVANIFFRIFGEEPKENSGVEVGKSVIGDVAAVGYIPAVHESLIDPVIESSPVLAQMVSSFPELADRFPDSVRDIDPGSYRQAIGGSLHSSGRSTDQLRSLRRAWQRHLFAIMFLDAKGILPLTESKRLQSRLAEASIGAAVHFALRRLNAKYGGVQNEKGLGIAVLGLGKLGGAGIDYGSDLDLILTRSKSKQIGDASASEVYARFAESFVTALSGYVREGSMYRVDLRLRPHGRNGPVVISDETLAGYIGNEAAVWELLAYLKMRAVGGDPQISERAEERSRECLLARAAKIERGELATETIRVRDRLEKERSAARHPNDVDLKFGAGGTMDIYFAIRFLQLLHGIGDDTTDRSSLHMLDVLHRAGALTHEERAVFAAAYDFYSGIDHALRLFAGRMTLLPRANRKLLEKVADRIGEGSTQQMIGTLNLHRISVRDAFRSVVK